MEFELSARSYHIFGSPPSVLALTHLFDLHSADFGPAIRKIELTFHFAHPGPPKKTLEEDFENFHSYRTAKLPQVVFRRSRETVLIDVATDLISGRRWDRIRELPIDTFRTLAIEVVEALRLLRSSVKRDDEFRIDEFLAHCEKALKRLPLTDEELAQFTSDAREAWEKRRAAMSEWDVLDIDWRDYHPSARTLLDDPFFWDCVNEFAPHGNDAGADLFEDYKEWTKRHPNTDPVELYRWTLDGWGYVPGSNDEFFQAERQDAAVGLAFAELKIRGACRPIAARLALDALQEQEIEAERAADWEHRDARLTAIAKLRAVLLREVAESSSQSAA